MFNWDSDYDELVEDRSGLIHVEQAPAPAKAGWRARLSGSVVRGLAWSRGFAGRWVMAGAVALALGAVGTAAMVMPQDRSGASFASFADWSLGLVGLSEQMPEGLLAYDQTQFDNFRRGIARFSDAELLDYLRATARDLDADSPTADFTRDAMFLTHREIERRGLPSPVARLTGTQGRS